jgi:hypothetical protein
MKRSLSQQTYVEATFPCLVLKTILILHTEKINLRINIAILSFCPFSFVLSLLHNGPLRSWSCANWSYQLGLPVPITTKVYGEVYSIQYYMTKLVSDVGCFLRFPPPACSETDGHDITEILLKAVHNLSYNNVFHLITASDYHVVFSISTFKYFHVMSVIEYKKIYQ